MTKNALLLALAAVIACYFIAGVIAVALFWPVKTLEIKNYSPDAPITIQNKDVRPGDRLIYELDYCKYSDGPVTVHRTLIDGQVVTLTDTQGQLPLGCHSSTIATAVVPETINPGKYYLDVTVEYKINVIRTQYVHYHTDYFVVIGKPRVPLQTGQESYGTPSDTIINLK